MNSCRRRQRPLAGTAGVRVADQGPIENRADPVHQRVMKHTLAKTRSKYGARLRVVDLESMTLTDPYRLIENLAAKLGDPVFKIVEEFTNLRPMALPARGEEGRL